MYVMFQWLFIALIYHVLVLVGLGLTTYSFMKCYCVEGTLDPSLSVYLSFEL